MAGKDQPLTASIEGDELVIRVGIDTLAYAISHSPRFYDHEKHGANCGPFFKIDDSRLFAREIVRALKYEEEDGSGPLSDLLDEAGERAIEDGAEGVDCDWEAPRQ